MLRVGLVVEGPSEWLALESVMRAMVPDIDFVHIRPDMTLVSGSPYGWRGVKAWCLENGNRLQTILAGVPSLPLHLVVIHADCSMAHNEGALRPCPPASDTADALGHVILRDWLGLETRPTSVVIVNPSRSTDAWVVAALDPKYAGLATIECDDRVEVELVRRGILRRRDNEVKKPASSYQPLVDQLGQRLGIVRQSCTLLERFCIEFAKAAQTLMPR